MVKKQPVRVPTGMGLAFVNAAAAQFNRVGDNPKAWIARSVQDKVEHTSAGMRPLNVRKERAER